MRLLKSIIYNIIAYFYLAISCTKNNYQKGKKGDFLFRKCASCEKVEF